MRVEIVSVGDGGELDIEKLPSNERGMVAGKPTTSTPSRLILSETQNRRWQVLMLRTEWV